MKKLISLLLAIVMVLSVATMAVAAVNYEQPFAEGTGGSKAYRIPALYTLNDGSVFAVADKRYDHGSDSPNNIDILFAQSADGYTGWTYSMPNYFDDYADNITEKDSASFIDSAIAQSSTGRIFVVSDVCPSGGGYLQALEGSGFVNVDGVNRLLLTDRDYSDKLYTFQYYVGEYVGDYAPVYNKNDNSVTAYSVDKEFNLYKNGVALMTTQKGTDEGKKIQQNIFYNSSELTCYLTTYLLMRYSDDNGKTWSAPVLLSAQVKSEEEGFLGIGPGRGIAVTLPDGTERIIFMVYDNVGSSLITNQNENVSTIYTDDNGLTWQRGAETSCAAALTKTSEAQVINMGGGKLRMFARNNYDYVAYADSYDYGHSWTEFKADTDLQANGNCMVSFINTTKTVNGYPVVLGSFASNTKERADGVIKTGLIKNGEIEWIATYKMTNGFYAYSCLTELADGNIGILYEDAADKVSYMILTMDDNGNLSEINGNNIEDDTATELNFFQKIAKFFKDLFEKILKALGMM